MEALHMKGKHVYYWEFQGNGLTAQVTSNKNPLLIIIPCHRVVAAHGLGGFGSGIDLKKYLLNLERS